MRNFSLFLARRYLFSRKSHSIINIISGVSSFAISVPVAAMIILLSVFNGFGDLVRGLYQQFDTDIIISSADSRLFDESDLDRARILSFDQIQDVSMVVEESVLLEYRGRQLLVSLRGVDEFYPNVVPLNKMIVRGEYSLASDGLDNIVLGQGIAYILGVRVEMFENVKVFYPSRGKYSPLLPFANYNIEVASPVGIYSLDAETDAKYAFSSLGFAQRVLDYEGKYTNAMVKIKQGEDVDQVREVLADELGVAFKVQTREQLNSSLYKIIVYEKWGLFFISLLVLIIASFSIIGSLVMLIIEKKKDIQTLRAMGANTDFIRGVFVREGMLISFIGAILGLFFGLGVCWIQIRFGLVRLPMDTFLVDSYPVQVELTDIIGIVVTFIVVSYSLCRLTVVKMVQKN